MPYREKSIEKLYWSIGEVAEEFGVNTSLLRYWEKEFDQLKPLRTANNGRRFKKKDIEQVRVIHRLLKEEGYTIQGAKERLRSGVEKPTPKSDTTVEVREKLLRIRKRLLEIRSEIDEPASTLF